VKTKKAGAECPASVTGWKRKAHTRPVASGGGHVGGSARPRGGCGLRPTLRAVVTFNETSYFIYLGTPMGFEYDLLREFAREQYLALLKSKPAVFRDPVVRYGYARGLDPVTYVALILERHKHYLEFVQ
jgi:hypothetical protein